MAMSMSVSRALAAPYPSRLRQGLAATSYETSPPRLPLLPRRPALTLASRPRILPSSPRMPSGESDLSPTPQSERTMNAWDLSSLWAGLPSYYLAGSLVDLGMSALPGVASAAFFNFVVAVSSCLLITAGARAQKVSRNACPKKVAY